MKTKITAAILFAVSAAFGASAASAQQSPCYRYEHGDSRRIDCLRNEERNAREYAEEMDRIYRDQRRGHEAVGRGLGRIDKRFQYAWDAPRYAMDGYNMYSDRRRDDRRRDERRRDRRHERR
jgi:hypothetical protein